MTRYVDPFAAAAAEDRDPEYRAQSGHPATVRGALPPRCRAYRRTRGVFVLSRVRCALAAGHAGQHTAPGRWLNPAVCHRWGRGR